MYDLIGVWVLESSENINEYLKQLGMSLAKRKINVTVQPKLIISKRDDSSVWSIEIDMKSKGTETLFSEGIEVDTSNELKFVFDSRFYFDSRRKSVSLFKIESSKRLVQLMKFTETEETQKIIKEINEAGNLVEYLEMNGISASRTFKRA